MQRIGGDLVLGQLNLIERKCLSSLMFWVSPFSPYQPRYIHLFVFTQPLSKVSGQQRSQAQSVGLNISL